MWQETAFAKFHTFLMETKLLSQQNMMSCYACPTSSGARVLDYTCIRLLCKHACMEKWSTARMAVQWVYERASASNGVSAGSLQRRGFKEKSTIFSLLLPAEYVTAFSE